MKKQIIALVIFFSIIQLTKAQRLPGSTYPFSSAPDTMYIITDNITNTQRLTIVSLQGLLARHKPKIIRNTGIWVDYLRTNGYIALDSAYFNDFTGLINHFKDSISGYILCDAASTSANVAISMASVLNGIVLTTADTTTLAPLGLNLLLDARGKDENWVLANYGSQLSTNIVTVQNIDRLSSLSDYSIFAGALQFWVTDASNSLINTAFNRMKMDATVMGFGPDEYNTVYKLSQYSLAMNASDWCQNLSVLTNIPVNSFAQKTPLQPYQSINNKHTVCFVFTDGDNIQWLDGDAASSTRWISNANTSQINLGWTMSPALSELAPPVLKYFYDKAPNTLTGRSYFVAGPSGRGYNFPGVFPQLDSETVVLNNYMIKSDLHIVNILDVDNSTVSISKFLDKSNIDALFYYKYSNYSGLNGQISWYNNKPSIGGRYNLWDGIHSTTQVAQLVNNLPTNINSSAGYSLIPVHAWSMTVDSVIACINKLDTSKVRVVCPDEFVWLIKQNIGSVGINNPIQFNNGLVYPNPASAQITIVNNNNKAIKSIVITNMIGTIVYKSEDTFAGNKTINISNLKKGIYLILIDDQNPKKFIVD